MGGQAISHHGAGGPDTASPDSGALFAPGELRDYFGFAVNAVRRRFGLAAAVLTALVVAAALVAQLLPRSYHVESRVYALPPENAPGAMRAGADEAGGLAQGAAEVVVGHERLIELIRARHLLQSWERSRVPLQRLLDRARTAALAPSDRESSLAAVLHKKLTVQVKGPEVIVAFDWPEAQPAFEVVEETTQRFLASRREAELVPLERKASSLDAAAAAAQARIDTALASIDAARKARRHGARAASVRGLQADGKFRDLPDARLAALRMQIIARRKAIAEQEDARRKHLSTLQALYAEQKATLGPGNPLLLDTGQKLASVEREGAQIEAMKTDEQGLLAEYVRAGGKEIELSVEPAPAWPQELKEDDEAVAYAKARIGMELSGLQQLFGEAASARVALAEARAAFDNRYSVLSPAELPEKPSSPRTGMLLFAAFVGGLFLAVLAAVAADLRGGVIRERWQVDRLLRLPVLAEIPEP